MATSICSRELRRAGLSALVAASGAANGGKLKTTNAHIAVSKTSTITAFDAAVSTFTGYADVVQTYGPPGSFPDNVCRIPGVRSKYQSSSAGANESIYNVYLVDSTDGFLVAAALLAAPIGIVGVDPLAVFLPTLCWGTGTLAGEVGVDLLTTSHVDRLTLNRLTVTGQLLDGALVHLFRTPLAITPDTPLATFTAAEATYDGYTSQAAVWLSGVVDPISGLAEISTDLLVWIPTGAVTANTIYGLWVSDSGNTLWHFAQTLDAPVTLQGTDTGLLEAARLTYGT